MSLCYWISMYITLITDGLRPPWAIKAQFSTRPNWASKTMVFLSVYFFLTDTIKCTDSKGYIKISVANELNVLPLEFILECVQHTPGQIDAGDLGRKVLLQIEPQFQSCATAQVQNATVCFHRQTGGGEGIEFFWRTRYSSSCACHTRPAAPQKSRTFSPA